MDKKQKKLLKKFYKSLGLKRNATQEEINRAIWSYVKNPENDLSIVVLTEEQMNDEAFLKMLYDANIKCLEKFPPSETLKSSPSFMADIASTISYSFMDRESAYVGIARRGYSELFKDILNNPEFFEHLLIYFPNENVDRFIRKIIEDVEYDKDKAFKKYWDVRGDVFPKLSEKVLISQAKQFGSEFLLTAIYALKGNKELQIKIIEAAIERDGFEALRYLTSTGPKLYNPGQPLDFDIDTIMENKHLFIKACEIDGPEALKKFIYETLSPTKKYYHYKDPNDPHDEHTPDYTEMYDERYENLQQKLLADPQIQKALGVEKEKTVDKKSPIKANSTTKTMPTTTTSTATKTTSSKQKQTKKESVSNSKISSGKTSTTKIIKKSKSTKNKVSPEQPNVTPASTYAAAVEEQTINSTAKQANESISSATNGRRPGKIKKEQTIDIAKNNKPENHIEK